MDCAAPQGLDVGELRDEPLNRETFTTLTEARVLIAQWRKEYNHVRPHGSLPHGGLPPEAGMTATQTVEEES